jgi:hypothetical protein
MERVEMIDITVFECSPGSRPLIRPEIKPVMNATTSSTHPSPVDILLHFFLNV